MESEVTSYRPLKAEKEYLKLIAANIINRFGDSIDGIAIAWLMYQITQSAALMALILGLNYLPTILLLDRVAKRLQEFSRQTAGSVDVGAVLGRFKTGSEHTSHPATRLHNHYRASTTSHGYRGRDTPGRRPVNTDVHLKDLATQNRRTEE